MASDWKETAISNVRIITGKANLSRRFSNVMIGFHSVAVILYGIGVLVTTFHDHNVDVIDTSTREFMLKMQLPFDCNESPLYELVTCLEFLHLLTASVVTGILNSLIIALVSGKICKNILVLDRLLYIISSEIL